MKNKEIKIIYNSQLAKHLGITEEKLKDEICGVFFERSGGILFYESGFLGKQFPSDVDGYSIEMQALNNCLYINLYKKSSDGEDVKDVFSIVSSARWNTHYMELQEAEIHNPKLLIDKSGLKALLK